MKAIDDPFDPIFVTAGPSPGKVEIQIGEDPASRYARVTSDQARRLAQVLLRVADEVERAL